MDNEMKTKLGRDKRVGVYFYPMFDIYLLNGKLNFIYFMHLDECPFKMALKQ